MKYVPEPANRAAGRYDRTVRDDSCGEVKQRRLPFVMNSAVQTVELSKKKDWRTVVVVDDRVPAVDLALKSRFSAGIVWNRSIAAVGMSA